MIFALIRRKELPKPIKVTGIGNAIVDILIEENDKFLKLNKIRKGVMQLINLERASKLQSSTKFSKRVAGGSAANTIVGLASLGLRTAYIGKVSDDELGNFFKEDLKKQKVIYETKFFSEITDNVHTGRCIVLVTPDAERSMNTYLGATEFLMVSDIDAEIISRSEWIYLEGYRFDGHESKAAFLKAINIAKETKSKIALTLSDPFCVERHAKNFRQLVYKYTDLLFCNETELKILYGTDELGVALVKGSKEVNTIACTLAEKGAIICNEGQQIRVPACSVNTIDTTGAGDLFAAGFLHGIIKGYNLESCAKMGNLAASEIISSFGARPKKNLLTLFQESFGKF